MSTINGTITGCNLIAGNITGFGARKAYQITATFPAYTGSSDTATITGVGAAISASTKNGKTITLRGGIPSGAGSDTAAQAVYFGGTAVQAATVSSDDLTGQLNNAAGTELTTTTGVSTGVQVIAIVDES